MKTNYTVLLITLSLFLFSLNAKATTHTVTVQNFSFTPSSMEVTVGDTILWMWVSGSHTTTSTSVPVGAATWDSNINSASTSFSFLVALEGTYNYHCSIHPTTMIGSFNATFPLGISPLSPVPTMMLNGLVTSNELQVTYTLETASSQTMMLFDLTGKQVGNFLSSFHLPGTFTETFELGNLSKGCTFSNFVQVIWW